MAMGEVSVSRVRCVLALALAVEHGGKVHGDTPDGEVDIQFGAMFDAVQFILQGKGDDTHPGEILFADIREGDTITGLLDTVTLSVRFNPDYVNGRGHWENNSRARTLRRWALADAGITGM